METTSQGLTIEKILKAKALIDAEKPSKKRIENHDTSFLEGGLCQH